jgi:hypothetical protein
MKFQVSLDKRIFTVTSNHEDAIYPDMPPGEPVIITDDITKQIHGSFWEPIENWTPENSMVGYGFTDDLNWLYQKVTGHPAEDEEWKKIEPSGETPVLPWHGSRNSE